MARVKNHYVNNKDLYAALVAYKIKVKKAEEEGKELPIIPDYIGVCFMAMCKRLSTKGNFVGYTYRDDMISDGIENCVLAVHGFDPERGTNPFAYFTQIIWNAFLRRIGKEKKQTYIKHKNFINSNLMDGLNEESRSTGQPIHNEYSDDIIRSFEDKLTKSVKKSKVGIEKFVEEESSS